MWGGSPDTARPALYPAPLRLIVVVLLLLCSAHAVSQPPAVAQLERDSGPGPTTLRAHRWQEVAAGSVLRDLAKPVGAGLEPNPLDRHALRWLRCAK